jgi:hypothetical protein
MSLDDPAQETLDRLVDIMRTGEWRDRVGACKSLLDRSAYVEEATQALREIIRDGEPKDSLRAVEILTKRGSGKLLSATEMLRTLSDEDIQEMLRTLAPTVDPLLQ